MIDGTNLLYKIDVPGASRSFYYNVKQKKTSWNIPSRKYTVVPAPDNFWIDPPEFRIPRTEATDKHDSIHTDKSEPITLTQCQKHVVCITDLQEPIPEEFYKTDHLPGGLESVPSLQNFVAYLRANIPVQKGGPTFEEILTPGKKTVRSPLMASSNALPKSPKSSKSSSLFRFIRKYIDSNDATAVESIFSIAESSEEMLNECFLEVITESNQTSSLQNPKILKAWELLMLLVAKYELSGQWRDFVLSYLITARGSKHIDADIKHRAGICIIRMFNRYKLGPEEDITSFVSTWTSMTKLFNTTLEEVIEKEKARGIFHKRGIPKIVERMVMNLLQLHADKVEGAFRVPGDMKKRDDRVDSINSGNWNSYLDTVNTAASLITYFWKTLQQPLIRREMLTSVITAGNGPDYLSLIDGMKPLYRDTLKYFFGMLKLLASNTRVTKMSPDNLAICIGNSLFGDIPKAASPTEIMRIRDQMDKENKFIAHLIQHMDTSDVF